MIADGVKRRIDAYFPPKAPRLAMRIFTMFRKLQNHAILSGGGLGGSYIVALNQLEIGEIARRDYGVDLSRYEYFFRLYERKLLEQQDFEFEQRKTK